MVADSEPARRAAAERQLERYGWMDWRREVQQLAAAGHGSRTNRRARLDLGKNARVAPLGIGGDLIELRQVLIHRHVLGDDRQHLALGVGGENHGGRQPGDAVLLRRIGVVIEVDFHRHEIGFQCRDRPRLIANFVFQVMAGCTPGRREQDQHEPIRLAGSRLGTIDGCVPMEGLLPDGSPL